MQSSFHQGLLVLDFTFRLALRGGKNFSLVSMRAFSTPVYTIAGSVGGGYCLELRVTVMRSFHSDHFLDLYFHTGRRDSGFGSLLFNEIKIGR